MIEGAAPVSRWERYFPDRAPALARGWQWSELVGPSRLFGANGMTLDSHGRLLVTQAFGSQVTAIDLATGRHDVLARPSMGVVGPDDGICAEDGTFFATEPFSGAVRGLGQDGVWRTGGSALLVSALASIAMLTIVMLLVWHISRALGFSLEDRIVALFCGSKKTLASGVPMARLIFGAHPGLGIILLPIMLYHPLQLVVGGWLAGRFARSAPASRAESLIDQP